jgi:hypothetical protein
MIQLPLFLLPREMDMRPASRQTVEIGIENEEIHGLFKQECSG